MVESKKIRLCIILCAVLIAIVMAVLLLRSCPEELRTEEKEILTAGLYSTTCLIEDYKDGEVSWVERRYDLMVHKSGWFLNGAEWIDSGDVSADQIMNFGLSGKRQTEEVELPGQTVSSVYEMSAEESRQYLLGKLESGWCLRRVIYMPAYVDVYLLDEEGQHYRALVSKNCMIFDLLSDTYVFRTLEEYVGQLENS